MNTPSKAAALAPDIDIVELTIADVQKGFLAGRFTSESLTRLHLERIEAYEPFYNAFTFMNPNAIAEARAIDERRKAGETLGPLAGRGEGSDGLRRLAVDRRLGAPLKQGGRG